MPRLTMVEFGSTNVAASAAFFEAVFSWPHVAYGPTYNDVQLEQNQTLGFQGDPDEAPKAPLVVIEVEDLAAARTAIEAAGGIVTVDTFSFPGGSRFHFREPGGNELAVWTPSV